MPCTRSARPITTTEAATVSDPGGVAHREARVSTEEAVVASTAATATTTMPVLGAISEASAAPTMAITEGTKAAVDIEIKTITTIVTTGTAETIKIMIGSSPESTMVMRMTMITTMAMM